MGFKKRHKQHMGQVEDDSNGSTTLSSHIKSLRESNTPHTITWSAKERAPPFNPSTWWCRLCTLERYYILFEPSGASLNQRAEFFCHCFHKRSKLLVKPKRWTVISTFYLKFLSSIVNLICYDVIPYSVPPQNFLFRWVAIESRNWAVKISLWSNYV